MISLEFSYTINQLLKVEPVLKGNRQCRHCWKATVSVATLRQNKDGSNELIQYKRR